jgi:1-acyl-sn-glycerol-3-phosphate acyltransferase
MHNSKNTAAISTDGVPATHKFIRGIRWTRLMVHIGVGLLLAGAVFPRASARGQARITQWWSQKTLHILNVILSVHGARPAVGQPNVIIASNHISWLDIYVINAANPARFVAKAEIRDWPIVGWLCEKAGTIFIHRSKRSDTARINDEMHDVLATGWSIGLFPEGTTTAGNTLLKFHSSLFEPAVVNRALVSPIALRYRCSNGERSDAAAYIGELSFAESLTRIIGQKSMIAEVTFASPIVAANMTRRALALQAEAAVASILNVPLPHATQKFTPGVAIVEGTEARPGTASLH